MSIKRNFQLWISLALLSMLSFSCSKESDTMDAGAVSNGEATFSPPLVFRASYTPEQDENIRRTGAPFLPEQEKNAWNDTIQRDLPATLGMFFIPKRALFRAAGVNGSYPGRYWTMIRVKTGPLEKRARRYLNEAVHVIESETNVRFYNSQEDPEYYEPYHIKLPNIYVRTTTDTSVGSGSFGMTGEEQYINVPSNVEDSISYPKDKVLAFFLHALCNAAGMFNEVQRPDRDDYVDIFWGNIPENCHKFWNKETNNYSTLGKFDYKSITMFSSKTYSKNGQNTIVMKGGHQIEETIKLSDLDKIFLNSRYLPFIARTDTYTELDSVVYSGSRRLSEEERLQLQRSLNERWGYYGDPPLSGRAPKRKYW